MRSAAAWLLCRLGVHAWKWSSWDPFTEVCVRARCRGKTWRRVNVLQPGQHRPRVVRPIAWGDDWKAGGRDEWR